MADVDKWLEDEIVANNADAEFAQKRKERYVKFLAEHTNVTWIPSARVLDMYDELDKVKNPERIHNNPELLRGAVVANKEYAKTALEFAKLQTAEKNRRLRQMCETRQIQPGHPLYSTSRHSFGLFAKKDIAAGTAVGEYGGILRLLDKKNADEDRRFLSSEYVYECTGYEFQLSRRSGRKYRLYVDATHMYNDARFANDNAGISEFPTCAFVEAWINCVPYVVLVTTTEVPANGELTLEYGSPYWINSYQLEVDKHLMRRSSVIQRLTPISRTPLEEHEYDVERAECVVNALLNNLDKLTVNGIMYMDGGDVQPELMESIAKLSSSPIPQNMETKVQTLDTITLEDAANISVELAHKLATERSVTTAVCVQGAAAFDVLGIFDLAGIKTEAGGEYNSYSNGKPYVFVDNKPGLDRLDFFSRAYPMDILNLRFKFGGKRAGRAWLLIKTDSQGLISPSPAAHLMDAVSRTGAYKSRRTVFRPARLEAGAKAKEAQSQRSGCYGDSEENHHTGNNTKDRLYANVALVQHLSRLIDPNGFLYRYFVVATRNIAPGEILTVNKGAMFWHAMFMDGVAHVVPTTGANENKTPPVGVDKGVGNAQVSMV